MNRICLRCILTVLFVLSFRLYFCRNMLIYVNLALSQTVADTIAYYLSLRENLPKYPEKIVSRLRKSQIPLH